MQKARVENKKICPKKVGSEISKVDSKFPKVDRKSLKVGRKWWWNDIIGYIRN
ncbi:hypothetical protein ANABIO32_11800 [Rossellomorea marisflavi]|uniref:hypothetical protein n=1 Tax=Rossellomorea marisflavi TaxID=189381 RepID=UPI0025C7A3C5|nr:hypothetical protein [Rossellomorea marisflavi]GLI83487.1 hypothetical protein ANABIO32_11800 [Rossellomorea marisflavi]